MKKLRKHWNLQSNWAIIAILLVFSINGSFATWVAKPITEFIGIHPTTHGWIFWMIRIPLIFIVYQVTLPIVGWLFGQFQFFWAMERKMIQRIGLGFLLKN